MELIRLQIGDLSDEEYRDGYRNMSASRREKCDRYLHETDRKCCIAADWAVRRALSERFGASPSEIEIRVTDQGKPYAPELPVCFSYAHSGEQIVLALSKREVGADIERVRPVSPRITRYFCCEADLVYAFGVPRAPAVDLITDPDALSRLFEVWTFKEALGKAWGTGLTRETKYAAFADHQKLLARDGDYVLCAYECEECI